MMDIAIKDRLILTLGDVKECLLELEERINRLEEGNKELKSEIKRRKGHPTDNTTLDGVDVIKAGGTMAEIKRGREK